MIVIYSYTTAQWYVSGLEKNSPIWGSEAEARQFDSREEALPVATQLMILEHDSYVILEELL